MLRLAQKLYWLPVLICSLALSACGDAGQQVAVAQSDRVSKHSHAPSKSSREAGQCPDAPGGPGCYLKPGASVRLADLKPLTIEPGEPSAVELGLVTASNDGHMRVSVTASKGLLLSGQDVFTFALDGSESDRLPLQLLAAEPGRYYIHLQIAVEGDQPRDSGARAISAAVQVGPESRSAGVQAKSDGGVEQKTVILPARETIVNP